jgi:hypothetical protein
MNIGASSDFSRWSSGRNLRGGVWPEARTIPNNKSKVEQTAALGAAGEVTRNKCMAESFMAE